MVVCALLAADTSSHFAGMLPPPGPDMPMLDKDGMIPGPLGRRNRVKGILYRDNLDVVPIVVSGRGQPSFAQHMVAHFFANVASQRRWDVTVDVLSQQDRLWPDSQILDTTIGRNAFHDKVESLLGAPQDHRPSPVVVFCDGDVGGVSALAARACGTATSPASKVFALGHNAHFGGPFPDECPSVDRIPIRRERAYGRERAYAAKVVREYHKVADRHDVRPYTREAMKAVLRSVFEHGTWSMMSGGTGMLHQAVRRVLDVPAGGDFGVAFDRVVHERIVAGEQPDRIPNIEAQMDAFMRDYENQPPPSPEAQAGGDEEGESSSWNSSENENENESDGSDDDGDA